MIQTALNVDELSIYYNEFNRKNAIPFYFTKSYVQDINAYFKNGCD